MLIPVPVGIFVAETIPPVVLETVTVEDFEPIEVGVNVVKYVAVPLQLLLLKTVQRLRIVHR